jgi:hypothetical protein
MVADYRFQDPENIGIEEFGDMMFEGRSPISNFPTPFLVPNETENADFTGVASKFDDIQEDDESSNG